MTIIGCISSGNHKTHRGPAFISGRKDGIMKAITTIRGIFQLLSFVCFLIFIGSISAWENANISFIQMMVQLFLFGGLTFVTAKLGKKRRVRSAHAPHSHVAARAV